MNQNRSGFAIFIGFAIALRLFFSGLEQTSWEYWFQLASGRFIHRSEHYAKTIVATEVVSSQPKSITDLLETKERLTRELLVLQTAFDNKAASLINTLSVLEGKAAHQNNLIYAADDKPLTLQSGWMLLPNKTIHIHLFNQTPSKVCDGSVNIFVYENIKIAINRELGQISLSTESTHAYDGIYKFSAIPITNECPTISLKHTNNRLLVMVDDEIKLELAFTDQLPLQSQITVELFNGIAIQNILVFRNHVQ